MVVTAAACSFLSGTPRHVTYAARQIDAAPDGQRLPRTHLFVAATLYADGCSSPVNIRNMSKAGALIEGAVIPDVGDRMMLKRGPLEATGVIAWRAGRRAGVRLAAAICVADWMARLANSGQERVDALVAIVRNEPTATGVVALSASETRSIEAELGLLRCELAGIESSLLDDPLVVANHPEIQALDVAMQRIDRMVKRLRAGG